MIVFISRSQKEDGEESVFLKPSCLTKRNSRTNMASLEAGVVNEGAANMISQGMIFKLLNIGRQH